MKYTYSLIIVVILYSLQYTCKANEYDLRIKVVEKGSERIKVDFKYTIFLDSNNDSSMFIIKLPFENNPNIETSVQQLNNKQIIFHGFTNDLKEGYILVNSLAKESNIEILFKGAFLPIQKSVNMDNTFSITINFNNGNNSPFSNNSYVSDLKLKTVFVQTDRIVDSNPKYQLSDEGVNIFKINAFKNEEVLFMTLPEQQKSYEVLFIGLFILLLGISTYTTPRIVKKKSNSILGMILGALGIGLTIWLFIDYVLPTEFVRNIDIISIIAIISGTLIGIFFGSSINIIKIIAIEKQQSAVEQNGK